MGAWWMHGGELWALDLLRAVKESDGEKYGNEDAYSE